MLQKANFHFTPWCVYREMTVLKIKNSNKFNIIVSINITKKITIIIRKNYSSILLPF